MAKRTPNTKKSPHDFWATPVKMIERLVPHLDPGSVFIEPCAGDGVIVQTLMAHGMLCSDCLDIVPQHPMVRSDNALYVPPGPMVITNPPYRWDLLEPLLKHWVGGCEAWLLLPWDMTCNKRFNPYARHIDRMLPLGRVSWMGNGQSGYENSGWFHFALGPQDFVLPR